MLKTNSNNLYRALHRLNRQMHRSFHREGRGKGGIYHGQANLLLIILKNDGASQRDLAEQLDVRPSSMTEMLTKLEQSGMVLRKQDDKDQRVMRIYLTEEGKRAAEEIAESKDAFAESFFSALNEDEQEQLLILIEKLCASLEAAEDFHEGDRHHGHGSGHHGERYHGACCGNGMHHDYGHGKI
nr:MarR family transcriptional regulator [uncultured Aminipila sp.]